MTRPIDLLLNRRVGYQPGSAVVASPDTVIVQTLDFDGTQRDMTLTVDQLRRVDRWANGEGLIQNMLPELTADQREQLLSGLTPEQWPDEEQFDEFDGWPLDEPAF